MLAFSSTNDQQLIILLKNKDSAINFKISLLLPLFCVKLPQEDVDGWLLKVKSIYF